MKIYDIFKNNVETTTTIQGEIIEVEYRKTRNNSFLCKLFVYDTTSTILVSFFADKQPEYKEGDFIRVKGRVESDRFNRGELTMKPRESAVKMLEKPNIPDTLDDGREESRVSLQNYSFMTSKQGAAPVEHFVEKASKLGHKAIAVTDNGVVMAFPDFKKAAEKHGIKPIFGMSANLIKETVMVYDNELRNLNEDIVIFDVETTGFSVNYNDVIELGAAKVSGGEVVDTFQAFIKTDAEISEFIQELTSITPELIRDEGKDLHTVIKEFDSFVGDAMLGAHNAFFDYHMLEQMYVKSGLVYPERPMVDTLKVSRKVNEDLKRHNLGAVARYFGVDLRNAHRADDDSKATAEVWINMVDKLKDENISTTNDLSNYKKELDYKGEFSNEITIWAKTQKGLKNLYKIVSESSTKYLSGLGAFDGNPKPLVTKDLLNKYREDLIVGSGGYKGFLFDYALEKPRYLVEEEIDFYDVIQLEPADVAAHLSNERNSKTNDFNNIVEAWKTVHEVAKEKDKLIIATDGANYAYEEEKLIHNIIVYSELPPSANHDRRKGKWEAPLGNAHLRSTNEMYESFPYLTEEEKHQYIVENTNLIADKIEDIEPTPVNKEGRPILYTPKIEGIDEKFNDLVFKNARDLYGEILPEYVEKRLSKEVESIVDNGFAVIYMISRDLVKDSVKNGYLVGSRGSVGSSLAATMSEITEVNPLKPHYVCESCSWNVFFDANNEIASGYDLPMNFSKLLDSERYSQETIEMFVSVMAESFNTSNEVMKEAMRRHDGTCPSCKEDKLVGDGQNIPFETFLGFDGDKVPDIDLNFSGIYQEESHKLVQKMFGKSKVFRAGTISTVAETTAYAYVSNYFRNNELTGSSAEVKRISKKIVGSRTSTGQHPGGMLVVPNDMEMEDFCPYNFPANNENASFMTSHFGYKYIEDNMLKLDILGHEAPTLLRYLQDYTGVRPQDIPSAHPDTIKLFNDSKSAMGVSPQDYDSKTGTMGLPEMGTDLVQNVITETEPKTFGDLVVLSGLTHGTGVYQGNAQTLIKEKTATIDEVIGTRDDILDYLISKGLEKSLSFTIMESVRKGKGLKPEWEEEMKNNNVPDWYIWSCKQIEYMFPKAHAAAYVLDATRSGYYKVNYPLEFTAAIFSARYSQEDIFKLSGDAERSKEVIKELKEEISELKSNGEINAANGKERTLTAVKNILESKLRGVKFGNVRLYESHTNRYLIDKETNEIIPPFSSVPSIGPTVAEALYNEKFNGVYRGLDDLVERTKVSKTGIQYLRSMGCLKDVEDEQATLI